MKCPPTFIKSVFGFTLYLLCLSQLSVSAAPNPDGVNALWVAESSGVLKAATADGSVLFEITSVGDTNAIAVDQQRGRVWAHSGGTLRQFDFSGQELITIDVALASGDSSFGPSQVVDVTVDLSNGNVWLAASDSVYRFDVVGGFLSQITCHTV